MIKDNIHDALDVWIDYDSIAALVESMGLEDSFSEMRMIENIRKQCFSILNHAILSCLTDSDYEKIKSAYVLYSKTSNELTFDDFLLISSERLPYVKDLCNSQLKFFLTRIV